MSDETGKRTPSLMVWIGGAGLLGAVAVDVVAVAGRHLGIAMPGSIELVQVFVIIAASIAIAAATLADGHARVELVYQRVSQDWRRVLVVLASVLSVLYFLVLVVGSGWILIETWGDSERTEVLGFPMRWLRVFWIGNAVLAIAGFVLVALRWKGSRG